MTENVLSFHSELIHCRRRVIDRHLIPRIRYVNRGFDHVRVPVRTFREGMRRVDLDVHNVIAFRHAGDVYPLAAELFKIPIRPPAGERVRPILQMQ